MHTTFEQLKRKEQDWPCSFAAASFHEALPFLGTEFVCKRFEASLPFNFRVDCDISRKGHTVTCAYTLYALQTIVVTNGSFTFNRAHSVHAAIRFSQLVSVRSAMRELS